MKRIVPNTDNSVLLSDLKNTDHIGLIYKGMKYAIATKLTGPSKEESKYKYQKLNRKMTIGIAEYESKKALLQDHEANSTESFVFNKSSELMDWLLIPVTK